MGIMEKSSGLANLRAIICIVVTATLIGCCDCSYNTSFHWLAGDWSRCLYKEPGSCCDCHHIRDISCVYLVTEETVPPFYCHKTGRPAPTDREPCSPCQQVFGLISDAAALCTCMIHKTVHTKFKLNL